MSDLVQVATRKGLFEVVRAAEGWKIAGSHFMGDPISAVITYGGMTLAAPDLGHFGPKLWRREGAGEWAEMAMPAFPEKPDDADDDPHPWTLGRIWNLTPGGVDGRLYAGTMPGGLFRSDDMGESWTLIEALWRHPDRKKWFGVAGGEMPGISSVLVDPRDAAHVTVGVSTGGVWSTRDEGATWSVINKGMVNEYMPPDQQGDSIPQDIHQLSQCPGSPDVVWCQHHSAIFRSTDGGENWSMLDAAKPTGFGFAVVAHPTDPETAWFVPAEKDERRIPVDGKLVVSRTRDGGKTFEVLSDGLPQRHAYDLVYRHALAVDETGERLAFGSTSGGVWISEDAGNSWSALDARLPPVAAVAFA
jgi:photosystem II stability/assembly factor-like uncharacterized protein